METLITVLKEDFVLGVFVACLLTIGTLFTLLCRSWDKRSKEQQAYSEKLLELAERYHADAKVNTALLDRALGKNGK